MTLNQQRTAGITWSSCDQAASCTKSAKIPSRQHCSSINTARLSHVPADTLDVPLKFSAHIVLQHCQTKVQHRRALSWHSPLALFFKTSPLNSNLLAQRKGSTSATKVTGLEQTHPDACSKPSRAVDLNAGAVILDLHEEWQANRCDLKERIQIWACATFRAAKDLELWAVPSHFDQFTFREMGLCNTEINPNPQQEAS